MNATPRNHNFNCTDELNNISLHSKRYHNHTSSIGNRKKGIMKVCITNNSYSAWHNMPSTMKRVQNSVTFRPLITVNTYHLTAPEDDNEALLQIATATTSPVHTTPSNPSAEFEQRRQKEMTRCCYTKDVTPKNTQEEGTKNNHTYSIVIPLINTEGKVNKERRLQQRTATMAILSYQKRLSDHSKAASSSNFTILMSPVSQKLSQRAKDIAREIARQMYLEVYDSQLPFSPISSYSSTSMMMIPIPISEFPELKKKNPSKKKKREYPTSPTSGETLVGGCTPSSSLNIKRSRTYRWNAHCSIVYQGL